MDTSMTSAAMAASTNGAMINAGALSEMRDDLMKKLDAINALLKIQEEIDALDRAYKASIAELHARLNENPFFVNTAKEAYEKIEDITSAEVVGDDQNENKEALALPEPEVEKVATPIKKKSVFDNPAFKEPYHPMEAKSTNDSKENEELTSMAELLSDASEYKVNADKETPINSSNSRTLSTMDELLSGKPVKRILCLGNFKRKGEFRQHDRICDAKGVCPTLTAMGSTTYVYV